MHLNDALKLIDGRKDFVVKRDLHYIAIDYVITLPDTFDDTARNELRGIKFHPDTGEIMARPFHKFFNLGEKEHVQPHMINFDSDHVIMDKLDGSMIHPALLRDGSVRFMTRMGMTDVAQKAERHLTPFLRDNLKSVLSDGYTPIFEFTAPDNRIVIEYRYSDLTLLAIRNNITGEYSSREEVESIASMLGVPVVRTWNKPSSAAELIETVRAIKNAEGVVIAFASGLWIKIKCDEYVLLHKTKDSISREKNVLAIILDGHSDDLRPLMLPDDRKKFDAYELRVTTAMLKEAKRVQMIVDSGASMDQKTFANKHLSEYPPWLRALAFAVRSGKISAIDAVRQSLRKSCSTQNEVDAIRDRIQATW